MYYFEYSDIKTFKDACIVLGYGSKYELPDFLCYPQPYRQVLISECKLVIIIAAVNYIANGKKIWIPDFSNEEQLKHEPNFSVSINKRHGVYCTSSEGNLSTITSSVGSRFCFISKEVMNHVACHFAKLFLGLQWIPLQEVNVKKIEYNDLKTFKDACIINGLNHKNIMPDFANYPKKYHKAMLAKCKLLIIIQASKFLNVEQELGYDDRFMYCRPRFYMPTSTTQFKYKSYDSFIMKTFNSYFNSEHIMQYISNQFSNTFRDYLV